MVQVVTTVLKLVPMAVVILWGLASSTVLNMFVVPALYLRFGTPAREVVR